MLFRKKYISSTDINFIITKNLQFFDIEHKIKTNFCISYIDQIYQYQFLAIIFKKFQTCIITNKHVKTSYEQKRIEKIKRLDK